MLANIATRPATSVPVYALSETRIRILVYHQHVAHIAILLLQLHQRLCMHYLKQECWALVQLVRILFRGFFGVILTLTLAGPMLL